jgi:hypothetical protein
MLVAVEQRQLVDENRTQGKALGVAEALGGDRAVDTEDGLKCSLKFSMASERSLWKTRRTSTPRRREDRGRAGW